MENSVYFADNLQILHELPNQSGEFRLSILAFFTQFIFFQIASKTTILSSPKLSSVYLVA